MATEVKKITTKDLKEASKKEEEEHEDLQHIERYKHYDIYVRHPYFAPGVKCALKIRKSLAEVAKEQTLFDPGVYFQRVFIFGKKQLRTKSTSIEAGDAEWAEEEEISLHDFYSSDQSEEELSYEEEFEFSEDMLAKKSDKGHKSSKSVNKLTAAIEAKINKIAEECTKINITPNNVSGVYLRMGDEYILFIVEGSEDVLALFFRRLLEISNEFWSEAVVFQLEDYIDETYFDKLTANTYGAVNTNERFLPSVINDREFMAAQHWDFKHRLQKLCQILSSRYNATKALSNVSSDESVGELDICTEDLTKFLPEVQCVELILKCTRFYRSFESLTKMYGVIPFQKDEDASHWPLPSDYTPLGVFHRFEFDVNLTFGDYIEQPAVVPDRTSSEDHSTEQ